jgi:hypothetical protein
MSAQVQYGDVLMHAKVVPQKKDYQNIVKNTVSLGAVKMLCKNVRLQDDYGF